jgi:tetratricopeptide (TPR) repeat protein
MANFLLKILLILTVCFFFNFLNAQDLQKTDSLELSLELSTNPEDKVELLLGLSEELKNNDPYKALDFAEKAYQLSESENYEKGILNSLIGKANIYWGITDFKTAMEFAETATVMAEELGMQKELALSLRITGLIYIELSDFEKALNCFLIA